MIKKWISGLIFLQATLPAVGQTGAAPQKKIFPKEVKIFCDLLTDSSATRFTPLNAEADSADSCLFRYFETLSTPEKTAPDPEQYHRQYAGFFINGKKSVFVNGSCKLPDHFTENIYLPRGGGVCYFQALIDLADKKIIRFMFNAPR